jgi:sugar transferase EpsL
MREVKIVPSTCQIARFPSRACRGRGPAITSRSVTKGDPVPRRYEAAKRGLDVILVAVLMVAFLPVMAVVGAGVYIFLGLPVLFRQERAGRHGRPFVILKFRTMIDDAGADNVPVPDEVRITRLGRFLRTTGLDELPQLWNVLRGEMSLVGPRPLYMRYLDSYTPEQSRRHEALPGITGLAQINGRSSLDWQEQFDLDVWYVDHPSLQLDMLILWQSLLILLGLRRAPGLSSRSELTATLSSGQRLGGNEPIAEDKLQRQRHRH